MDEISNNICTTELPLEHENLPSDGDSPVQLGKTGNKSVNIDNIPSNDPHAQVLQCPMSEHKYDHQEKVENTLISSNKPIVPNIEILKDSE